MMSASYYLRKGDYLEADRFYKILREEYPKSPYLEDAFVLGSHVKLMSYQGAIYDGKALEEAERLKESTLKLFPQTAERDRIEDELRKMADAEAERQWKLVEFYRKKGRRHQRSVAVTCHTLITKYPSSRFAPQARKIYAELPDKAKEHLPPLPHEPSRTATPELHPVPNEPYGQGDPTPGRVRL
jgi:outer membrane protein assembly factor BamD (BamD/ComL family)